MSYAGMNLTGIQLPRMQWSCLHVWPSGHFVYLFIFVSFLCASFCHVHVWIQVCIYLGMVCLECDQRQTDTFLKCFLPSCNSYNGTSEAYSQHQCFLIHWGHFLGPFPLNRSGPWMQECSSSAGITYLSRGGGKRCCWPLARFERPIAPYLSFPDEVKSPVFA